MANFGKLNLFLNSIFFGQITIKNHTKRMSYEDFLKLWDIIYLCHITADCFLDELFKKNKVI